MAMAIRLFRKKDESDRKIKIPEGRWIKCDACLEIIYKPEVERNLNVCPKCVYHFRIPARERIRAVIDEGTFVEFAEEMEAVDVLNFTDTKKYVDRLKEAKKKTGRKEAVITGTGKIHGIEVALAVLDFEFQGGSMGSVVGEKVALTAETALESRLPLIISSAPGAGRRAWRCWGTSSSPSRGRWSGSRGRGSSSRRSSRNCRRGSSAPSFSSSMECWT